MIDQKVKINAFFKDDKIYRLVFYIKIKKDENINLIDEELSKKYSLFYEKLNEAHYKANSFFIRRIKYKSKIMLFIEFNPDLEEVKSYKRRFNINKDDLKLNVTYKNGNDTIVIKINEDYKLEN